MSSIFLSFATLTRPSTLLLPFLILPFTFFYKKNELKKSFLFLLTFLFLLMPWTIRNYQVTNRFISIASLGAFNLWDGTYYSCVLYNTGMALSVDKEMFSEHERIRSNYYYIDYQAEPEFMKQALIRIKDKPFTYIRFCIERIIRVYSAFPGTRDLMISKPILYWPLSIFQILFNTFGLIGILKLDKTIKFTIIGMLLYSIFFNSLFNLLSRYTLPWSILIIIGLSIFLVDNTNIIYKKFKGK
jgi:hypothetical protein